MIEATHGSFKDGGVSLKGMVPMIRENKKDVASYAKRRLVYKKKTI